MISEKLLTHTVTLKKPTGFDRDRNEAYAEFTIERTRMNADIGQAQGSEGLTPSDTATLYVDAARSVFKGADGGETEAKRIDGGDRVEWNGLEFTVLTVKPCYAKGGDPHHWEVGLK